MKYLTLLILSLSILLSSCNNHNEPPLEVRLPISEVYVPVSVEFNEKEISQEVKSQLIHLVNNQFVINDVSEIPDDPLGLNDYFGVAFDKVNFNEYTLLIKYIINDWTIDSYNNYYYRNTQENTYNWSINIGTASDTELYRFTRFAILVKKLPTDAKVVIWQGLTQLGWYPE